MPIHATTALVYAAAALALLWLWAVEGRAPDRWDLIGAALALIAAAIILFAPRDN